MTRVLKPPPQKWLRRILRGACFLFINHRGQAQGINAEGLALALKITERKLAQHFISNARKEDTPICSTPETGYFLPETSEELTPTLSWLRNRASTTCG